MAKSDMSPGKFEVLIVDDQAHMRALLRDFVQSTFPGHLVASALGLPSPPGNG